MSDYPAGWYDDPKTEGQERYWDGTGWTHDVRQAFAAGWYGDPDRFGAERYWDGAAWTDDRRFVTRLDDVFQPPTLRKKEQRLLVSGEELRWGDDSIRWDDVTGFDTVTMVNQGRVATYRVIAMGNNTKLSMEIPADTKAETRVANAFATIVDQAQRILAPRILNELYKRADAGEPVEYEKVVLSPQGFSKGSRDKLIPWSEYGGWRSNGAYFNIDRMKGDKTKKGIIVHTTQLGRWILSALVDDYSRRYSGA